MKKLTITDYQHLIDAGETLSTEFKSDKKLFSDKDIYDYVVGLTNTQGGYLFIGIEDDHSITGLNSKREESWFKKINIAIRNNSTPPIDVESKIIDIKNKSILVIKVPAAKGNIHSNGKGVCYHRVLGFNGPENRTMLPFQHISKLSKTGQYDLSTQVFTEACFEDLDPIEFARLRKNIQKNTPNDTLLTLHDIDLAKGLGFVRTENNGDLKPTLLGFLIVGKEESLKKYVPTHEIAFQVMDNALNAKINRFLKKPILSSLEEIETLFNAQNNEKEFSLGFLRIPIHDYSPYAFREALLNALIHRDYSLNQAIYIQIRPEEMKITSPGGFVDGITLHNFLSHEPKPRNPQLATACQRIGLVERLGRGIDKIFIEQLRLGRCAPDYAGSTYDAVRVYFPGGEANLNFAKFARENDVHALEELLILNYLQEAKRIDIKEATSLVQETEAKTKKVIESLVSKNFLTAKGEKSGRVYTLSSWVYKELGILEEYIRIRGFEPIQYENMIMTYISENGFVKRIDVEKLCHLNKAAASRLLLSLQEKGKLQKVGSGNNFKYIAVRSSEEQ